jgi:Ran-binding protein 9/10
MSPETDKTLVSSLPVLWGRYSHREGAKGVYYEVEIEKLGRDAVVAIGFGCLPYPTDFRLPGWHRHSAAVHSDDGFKFFENPDGGLPFMKAIKKGGIHPSESSNW